MNFNALLGNEKTKQQLTALVETGKLPHAIVFEGEEGMGKRTLAKELALNLLCINQENKPCRTCPQCVKVLKGVHPDVYEFTAPGGAGSFHVDDVRRVIEDVYVSPNEASYKIYILGNCQCMNVQAQNALLKVLEEPPEYVVFILTVTNKSALLETVLSRSVVFSLEGVNPKDGADLICSQDETLEYDEVLKALEVWGGNIGRAKESLSDGRLAQLCDLAQDIAAALLSENEYTLVKACAALSGDREAIASVMDLLKTLFRDALFYGSTQPLSGLDESAKQLSAQLSKKMLYNLVDKCEQLKQLSLKNLNNNLLITKIPYELRRCIGK